MNALQIAMFAAFGLFILHMSDGRTRMHLLRCRRCNAHPWDKHEKDCPWKGKYR